MSAIQRMIHAMQRPAYASKTIKEYSASLRRLSSHFACYPSKLSLQQVREYQLHLARRKDISWSYYNATVTALRFMYLQTLKRDWSIERLPYAKREHHLPGKRPASLLFRRHRHATNIQCSKNATQIASPAPSAAFRFGPRAAHAYHHIGTAFLAPQCASGTNLALASPRKSHKMAKCPEAW